MLAVSFVEDRDRGSRRSFPEVTVSAIGGRIGNWFVGRHSALSAAYWATNPSGRRKMAVASVSKITAASPTSFDAAIQEGLARANRTLRGITGLHVIEEKASVKNGKIDEYRVTMEVTFILEG
jgi:dodecin